MKALWLALLLTACQSTPVAPEVTAKASVAVLGFTDGTCSGTFVAPNKILSAAHCFESGRLLTVNQTPVEVIRYQVDGMDHAVVTLGESLSDMTRQAYVAYDAMPQGAAVFMYGNPRGLTDVLRRGYVAGEAPLGILLDLPVSGGDSGAGVFNSEGRLVGVVSGYAQLDSGVQLAVVRPFTSEFPRWPEQVED